MTTIVMPFKFVLYALVAVMFVDNTLDAAGPDSGTVVTVRVVLNARELDALKKLELRKGPLFDFVDLKGGAVADAIVSLRPRRSHGLEVKRPPYPPLKISINKNGDWKPRMVVLQLDQKADVTSDRENSFYQLTLPDPGAPGIPQFRPAQNKERPFSAGTTTSIGPFDEMKKPLGFVDDLAAGPSYRSKSGYLYVSSAENLEVSDVAGECRFNGTADGLYGVEIWHETAGWCDVCEIAGKSFSCRKEWLDLQKGQVTEIAISLLR